MKLRSKLNLAVVMVVAIFIICIVRHSQRIENKSGVFQGIAMPQTTNSGPVYDKCPFPRINEVMTVVSCDPEIGGLNKLKLRYQRGRYTVTAFSGYKPGIGTSVYVTQIIHRPLNSMAPVAFFTAEPAVTNRPALGSK